MRRTRKKRKLTTVTSPSAGADSCFHFKPTFRFALYVIFLSCLVFSGRKSTASGAPADKQHAKPYALIFGTVWGPDGRPVYGVAVKIRLATEKKTRWRVYSDHNGEFAQRVPAGKADYVIWLDLKGYKQEGGKQLHQSEDVKVHVDYDERVDTGLHLTSSPANRQ